MGLFELHQGDCLEILKTLPDNSVDACVSDPPYGLSDHSLADTTECLRAWLAGEEYRPKKRGFMGRSWDAWVPGPEVWREVLRVLKPGGHLLAFAGTRSMDLMSMAVRLAGFEMRDAIGSASDGGDPMQAPVMAWVYGSGFPKSMDVSKAIDKRPGVSRHAEFAAHLKERRLAAGFTNSFDVSERVTGKRTGACANWEKYQFPEYRWWSSLSALLGLDEKWGGVISEAEREVTGVQKGAMAGWSMDGTTKFVDRDITAPATDAARQWSGWGTALKPAWEPIILARKPLIGTVAQNVLAHGTGALNIDACRVPLQGDADADEFANNHSVTERLPQHYAEQKLGMHDGGWMQRVGEAVVPPGRWPANLIHDGSEEVVAAFPQAKGQQGALNGDEPSDKTSQVFGEYAARTASTPRGDTGSAARFFYCAKASRKDRNEGLVISSDEPVVANGATMREREDADWSKRNGNHHPTVKPTDLMAYLVRLVTPPGGVVLDPFLGSGSTGKAAIREGFRFIGCELSEEYLAIARARIEFEVAKIEAAAATAAAAAPVQHDLFSVA